MLHGSRVETTDLDQELLLLAEAARESQRELDLLTARLARRGRVGTVRELHDLKTHLTYLRLLLRSVARAASSTPALHGL